MAKVYCAPIDAPDFGTYFKDGRFDGDAYDKGEKDYMAKLAALAKANGSSDLLGEIIRFQRGDGHAQYMVWRSRPLELIWIETGDAWSVEDALIRGLRVSDVKAQVDSDKRIRKLFGPDSV